MPHRILTKPDRFLVDGELYLERQRAREGPPIYYICCMKRSSRTFTDYKDILKHIKWPTKTPTGDALREWLNGFEDKKQETKALDLERVKKEGFGPEAHEDDPTSNTKMVT